MDEARPGVFGRLYRSLGRRYPRAVLVLGFQLQNVVFAVGVGVLALYVPMSLGEYARLVVAVVVVQSIYVALVVPSFARQIGPLVDWLDGDRADGAAAAAWRSAASLPFDFIRHQLRHLFVLMGSVAWCLLAVWQLDLPVYALPILVLAVAVAQLYAIGLLFFLLERAMQPALDDIAAELSDEAEADALSLPLRSRLLIALPAINVITGVAVAGLSHSGHATLANLGIDVLIALAVALTLSLWLTVLLASSVVVPIWRLRDATARVAQGDLATRVPVVASDEAGVLTRSFNRMVAGLQERERLREAFGAFVDPELAERVLREGTDLAGEEVDASILFLDIRSFTSYAERASAREVVALLNDLHERIVPVILRHGGHANKFIGDGLLAVFGTPERHADHADRAVAAALEIAELVRDAYNGELRVGVGVNSGRVMSGTIGGGGRLDFTVIGDAVNTASRVESATRQTGDDVLITEFTRQQLTNSAIAWEERPAVPLKGKSTPLRLYAPAAQAPAMPAGAAAATHLTSL